MTDCGNAPVFTNDAVSQETSDLLQKAIQQVIDDDNNENQFVTLLQQEENNVDTITLTEAQAAALGYSFEIDTIEEPKLWDNQTDESIIPQNDEEQHDTNVNNAVLIESLDFKSQMLSQQNTIQVLTNCDVQDWNAIQNIDSHLLDNLKLPNSGSKVQKKTEDVMFSNAAACYMNKNLKSQSLVKNNTNQFVLKPSQNVTKNIKIYPNVTKMDGRQFEPSSNQSPILLPKTALLNTVPSIIRAIPVSSLNLNVGTQSTTLLTNSVDQSVNGKSILATSSDAQVMLPQMVMSTASAQSSISSNNGQRYVSPVLKTGRLVNSKMDIQKPIHIAPKMVPTATVNSSESLLAKSKKPIIFRAASILKDDESLIGNTSYSVQNRENVVVGTPISLLKNTSKVINGAITDKQTTTSGWKSVINNSVNGNSKQFGRILNVAGSAQNNSKSKFVSQINTVTGVANRKNDVNTGQTSAEVPSKSVSGNKPTVTGEHVVQIVQQGQTLHSLQQLSPAQLKQIATVLQSRIHNSEDSNEKVVYRIVFPEELDLKNRTSTNVLKNRISKRGRPKKGLSRNFIANNKSVSNEDQEDIKNERKKVVARTRSGRLSRPPRHMVRDYKHLHHLDFMQPDYDDSDGGYSDYNTQGDKLEDDESPKDLLTGLEVPKRKISDHFRCPTCNKIYLGRTRMSRHFEAHPDHGSPEQLPPPTPEPDLKQIPTHDPLKRKGKKRGPWAYVTPEAKSERRQIKLKEAISVCDNSEIIKIAAKPVVNAQSLYNLLVLKSENNVKNLLEELKIFLDDIQANITGMLLPERGDNVSQDDVIEATDKNVCNALGVEPGFYRLNGHLSEQDEDEESHYNNAADEPVCKLAKLDNLDEGKENIDDEQLSPDFSESANLDMTNLLHKKKSQINCPEVLSALTLMPRNPNPALQNSPESKSKKLLISSPEIQNQISDSSGFQKIDITNSPQEPKDDVFPQGTNCSDVFAKLNFDRNVKLQQMEQGFVKLDVNSYQDKQLPEDTRLETKMENEKLMSMNSACKVTDIMQETAQIITNSCDTNIFGNAENLPNYDHITHLDILNISGVIDKNLMMDDKLVEQLNLVDQSNIVDELVSERLKNMMPDNILEGNIMSNHTSTMMQDADLVFGNLADDFNRNGKS